MSQFWHQLVHALMGLMRAVRGYVGPGFHPRNPQGILALVTMIAFVIKRYTNVKRTGEVAYKRKFWQNMMRAALTYAAKMLEKERPKLNEAEFYDEELVRNKLQELRHPRQQLVNEALRTYGQR